MRLLLVAALLTASCATSKPTPPKPEPYLSGSDLEERALPPDPEVEALPKDTPPDEWVEAQEEGTSCKAGILESEARATRDGYYRLRYKELRQNYIADQKVWKTHRSLYERQLQLDLTKIHDLTPPPPSWWDENGATVIVVTAVSTGVLLGAGLTVGIAYSLYGTQ